MDVIVILEDLDAVFDTLVLRDRIDETVARGETELDLEDDTDPEFVLSPELDGRVVIDITVNDAVFVTVIEALGE